MNFKPAQFTARNTGKNQPPLRFAIRMNKNSGGSSLILFVNKQAAPDCGLREGEAVRMDFDFKAKLGRLIVVNQGDRKARGTAGSFAIQWPWNGDIAKVFRKVPEGHQGNAVQPLKVVSSSKTEGLIFEIPNHPV